VSFAIPESAYADLKMGASSLEFTFTVLPLVNYTLDTDKLDGNEAEVRWKFGGVYDTSWGSNAKSKKVGAGFLTKGKNGEVFEGSWVLPSINFGTPQQINMFFQCRAKGPGGIIVGSDSKCDASLRVNAIGVTVVANR